MWTEKMGDFLGQKLGDDFDISEYTALKELLENPYWRRIWTMQEFVLP
jgi:hypothetical protein